MLKTTKQRTVFQSTKSVLSSTADIVVASASTASEVVEKSRNIISNNMSAMYMATVRDNHVENSQEVSESLNIVDAELDALELALSDKSLTARQKKRIQMRIEMWEKTASVVEATRDF